MVAFLKQAVIFGEQLSFRFPQSDEYWSIYQMIVEDRHNLLPWMDWIYRMDYASQKRVFEEWKKASPEQGFHRILTKEDTPIGAIGMRIKAPRTAEVGYWIFSKYRGQGIVTRAVDVVMKIAFEVYQLHRVEIHCAADNIKSAAIPERLGFTLEAHLREAYLLSDGYHDLLIYGILRKEWEERNERRKLEDGKKMD